MIVVADFALMVMSRESVTLHLMQLRIFNAVKDSIALITPASVKRVQFDISRLTRCGQS